MKDALILSVLSVLPKNRVTRLMGLFARTRLPRLLHRAFIGWYIRNYAVDMTECDGTVEGFSTFTDFFTRALRAGLRPVDPDPATLVCPCDGRIYAIGTIENGWLPQSDGHRYGAATLLGGDTRYEGGSYAVIYLSPRDYHRVHSPREGRVVRFNYMPGRLWPVFPAAAARIEGLFARNERLTSYIATDIGEIALVMVGAFGVGRIRVVYDAIISNQGTAATDQKLEPPWEVARAGELGRFEMGSTVILLLPPGTVRWTAHAGDAVRLGQGIGKLTGRN